MKKYHVIYKTTNLKNGKYYIGKHSTNNLNDTYLGSGSVLKHAIKKYGKKSFSKTILFVFTDEKAAFDAENVLVENFLNDPMCYNRVSGGKGFDASSARMAALAAQAKGWFGLASLPNLEEICSAAGKKGAEINRIKNTGMFAWSFEERSEHSKRNQKDRIWITDGKKDLRINASDTLPEGFFEGRSSGNPVRTSHICWTNGIENIFSDTCPGDGFTRGMMKTTPTAHLPWWTDGITNKRAQNSPGSTYWRGRTRKQSHG